MSRAAPTPVDAPVRKLALSPATSCIVQAPAGSGKTTLLVTRFIRLLALAEYPEQVLAITFTRKAAAEMRLRVVALLADEDSPEGARARARDRERGWQLAGNPSRLNIRTIDSFAMSLTRQMPVSSGFDRTARLVENAGELYSLAARRLFRRLYEHDPLAGEIARFIALIDNDAHKARRLIAGMLARRDHWLDEVTDVVASYRKAPHSVAGLLNGAQETLVAAVTGSLEQRIPGQTLKELDWAIGFARGLGRQTPGAFWQAAGQILTTARGTLRKSLSARDGFPADCREEKRRALALIDALGALHLEERLAALRVLPPDPLTPEEAQDLVAICISLSLAVLDLSSVMRSEGVADFTELILAARRALRTGENPTELALTIDNRIRHILVDEFQDTSVVQFQLLELLVQGWSGESGVSLFAVGDPMQSIYRFRDADVGLFYRAESEGLDPVAPAPPAPGHELPLGTAPGGVVQRYVFGGDGRGNRPPRRQGCPTTPAGRAPEAGAMPWCGFSRARRTSGGALWNASPGSWIRIPTPGSPCWFAAAPISREFWTCCAHRAYAGRPPTSMPWPTRRR